MRRVSLLLLLLGMVGPGLMPSQALANNDPHRVFLPSGPVDLPVGFCLFPVHIEVVDNNEYGKFTTLIDGTVLLKETGAFKVEATNVDTGTTVALNASGPGTLTFPPDGSFTLEGRGHWLIFNLAVDAAPFELPEVMLTSGILHEAFDGSGTLTGLSVTGQATDVCALLA